LHQSAPDRIMMNTHDLQVSVRNTFVHAHEPEEEDEKAHELARSRSEPSISSSSMNSHSGDSDIGVPLRRPERPDQSCPSANPRAAITHGETSDSGNSSSSGFYDHVAGQEQRHKDETRTAARQEHGRGSGAAAIPSFSEDGPVWSVGAELHHICQCRPCAWYWRPGKGCLQGASCQFCHMCDRGEVKSRRKDRDAKLKAETRLAREEVVAISAVRKDSAAHHKWVGSDQWVGSASAISSGSHTGHRRMPQPNTAGQRTKISL